jgi:hypothetical protein
VGSKTFRQITLDSKHTHTRAEQESRTPLGLSLTWWFRRADGTRRGV